MTESKKAKFNSKAELKAISLILFVLVGFSYITNSRLLAFTIASTIILAILALYIRENGLKISKAIYYLLIAFYNIASIFCIIDYYRGEETLTRLNQNIFKPFIINDKIDIRYIGWILVLSIILAIISKKANTPSEEEYDR